MSVRQRVSRPVVDARHVRLAMQRLETELALAINVEHFGGELDSAEFGALQDILTDALEDAILSLSVPERPVVFG